jgi:hypothetical protein
VDQGFFCGVGFSRSMAPNETMPHMSKDHESWVACDGNHAMVLNPSEMIFIVAPMTRVSVWVPKPQSANEILDLQHCEVQCHV